MAEADLWFSKIETLELEVHSLKLKSETDQERLKHYESEVTRLNEMLRDLKRHRFGTKSERWESSEQLIFNEAEVESRKPDPNGDDDSDEEIEVKAHTKKRGHRRADRKSVV